MGIIAAKGCCQIKPQGLRLRQSVRADHRACHFGRAIDAVGVAGQRMDARRPLQRQRQRQTKFSIRPADAITAPRHCQLAARQQQHRRIACAQARLHLPRKRGLGGCDLARLALQRVAKDLHRNALRARKLGCGVFIPHKDVADLRGETRARQAWD